MTTSSPGILDRLKKHGWDQSSSDAKSDPARFKDDFKIASRRCIRSLRESGEELPISELDEWWRIADGILPAEPEGRLERGDLLAEFLDLATGPTQGARQPRDYAERPFASAPPGQTLAPGILSAGSVRAPGASTPARTFDEFASAFVDADGYDGVFLVSGVRGSGKSTLLARIEDYGRWFKVNDRRTPLIIRCDISAGFDDRQFAMDLASQVCQDSMKRLREAPFVPAGVRGRLVLAIGHLTRWCHANRLWALWTAAVVILLAFTAAYQRDVRRDGVDRAGRDKLRDAARADAAWHAAEARRRYDEFRFLQTAANSAAAANLAPAPADGKPADRPAPSPQSAADSAAGRYRELPKPPEVAAGLWPSEAEIQTRVIAALLAAILLLGVNESIRRMRTSPQNAYPDWDNVGLRTVLCTVLTTVCVGAAAAVLSATDFWPLARDALHRGWSAWGLVIGAALFLNAAVLPWIALPPWWEEYVRFRKLFLALRARQDQNSPDLPYFGNIASLVRGLLPRSDDEEEAVRELSVPMLQEQLKNVLRHAASVFGRVVFLLDDVDVMPSDKFHALMRVIRPFTKVRGVRCLVAAPAYFYYEFHASPMGDLHSTARDAVFLGDPAAYGDLTSGFAPIASGKLGDRRAAVERFHEMLRQFLPSRLRVRTPAAERDRTPGIITAILKRWENSQLIWAPRVSEWFDRVGQSRRELIREIARELAWHGRPPGRAGSAEGPLYGADPAFTNAFRAKSTEDKDAFAATETGLKAQESQRSPQEIRLVGPDSKKTPTVEIEMSPPTAAGKAKA